LPFMSDKSRIKTEKHLKMAVHNKTRKRSKKRVIKEESVKEESVKEAKEESEKEAKEESEKEEVKPEPTGAQKKPRCPKGQHRNKKTGECEPSK